MLERETESILRTITERTISDREELKLREALDATIPRGVKAYLRAEVSRQIERDLETTASISRVDRASAGGASLVRQLVRTLAEQYVFQRAEFLPLLDNAVHFLENYLCRPQWTLENFIFQEAETAAVPDVFRSLEYFADYAYFPALIERALRQREQPAITAEEFRTLLTRIDDQVVRQHSSRELALLTKPIVDFLLLENAPTTAAVPVKPILVFFDDKKLRVLKEYIEGITRIRNISELSVDDLAILIEDVHMGSVTPVTEPTNPAEETTSPSAGADQAAPSEPPTVRREPPAPPEAVPPPPVQPPPEHVERSSKNISLSLTFAGMVEKPGLPPKHQEEPTSGPSPELSTEPSPQLPSSINEMISEEMRERFARKVFGNDFDYYDGIIGALNGFESWNQASVYLEELYDLNGLDPARPEVQEFTDAVARWFTAKGETGG